MEVQKEAFSGLMEYYKKLPIELKRREIISEIEEIISDYSKICTKFGIMPDMMLNKEMLNMSDKKLKEEDFLNGLFAYINTLQDVTAQFINKMCDELMKETSNK